MSIEANRGMLIFLVCFSLSDDPSNFFSLSSPEFRDKVLRREESSTWVVLFSADSSDKSTSKAEKLIHASAKRIGKTVMFGIVNLTKEPFLARNQGISYLPCIRIFHQNGAEDYRGKYSVKDFEELLAKRITRFYKFFDRKWRDEATPSVVLFTDKNDPMMWKILASEFRNEFVRFGICNDFGIIKDLQISKIPSIVFYNNTQPIKYRGEMKIDDIRNAISAFIDGNLSFDSSFDDDDGFYRSYEFKDQCTGPDHCILYTGDTLDEEYKKLRAMNQRHKMKFFYGSSNIPFKQMKKDYYYIYNPRKGIIEIESIEKLESEIDLVLGGNSKWKSVDDLENKEL